MRQLATKVTRKGQITVPAEIRKRLGLQIGDSAAFFLDGEAIRFGRAISVVELTAGSLGAGIPALTDAEMDRVVEDAIAEEALREMSGE